MHGHPPVYVLISTSSREEHVVRPIDMKSFTITKCLPSMFIQQTAPVLGYFMMIFTFCQRYKWDGFTTKYVKEARFHISDIVFNNVFFQIKVCK